MVGGCSSQGCLSVQPFTFTVMYELFTLKAATTHNAASCHIVPHKATGIVETLALTQVQVKLCALTITEVD